VLSAEIFTFIILPLRKYLLFSTLYTTLTTQSNLWFHALQETYAIYDDCLFHIYRNRQNHSQPISLSVINYTSKSQTKLKATSSSLIATTVFSCFARGAIRAVGRSSIGFVGNNPSDAHNGAIVGHVFQHHGIGSDFDVVSNGDIAQHLCAGANHNVVQKRRVTFIVFLARTSQSGVLIYRAIVPDYRGFAYNYAHSMVDKQIFANFRGGMNFNPRPKSTPLCAQPTQKFQMYFVKEVSHSMPNYGFHSGIQQKYLQTVRRGGVAKLDRFQQSDFSRHSLLPNYYTQKTAQQFAQFRPIMRNKCAFASFVRKFT